MIIKKSGDRTQDVEELRKIAARPEVSTELRKRIDDQIRRLVAGDQGEREAAYEIDFHHGPSRNWAVIHDLRIEHEGRVAQIDHLIIGRFLDIWVCETKHFKEGVSINQRGEFTRFFGKQPRPMASPIEQNRKHVAVLDSILRSDKITLPTRLGMKLRPQLHSVILISQGARITRPSVAVDGLESIVKSDQLRTLIERQIDETSASSALMTIGKLVSSETLESFAAQVARLHRPHRTDWMTHFKPMPMSNTVTHQPAGRIIDAPDRTGLPAVITDSAPASATRERELLATSKLARTLGLRNVEVMLERLQTAGLLERDEGRLILSKKGLEAGGRFVEQGRYAPYFLWPRDLTL